jgi:thymidylate synthase
LRPYLNLLQRILDEGTPVQTGAYLPSLGKHPTAKSLFAAQFRHDLADGFPAVTTKKLYFASMVKELLWFLRGETNVNTLGCGIWNQWSNPVTGDCGPIYGSLWRHWKYAENDAALPVWGSSIGGNLPEDSDDVVGVSTHDQIAHVVRDLKAVAANPFDRARRRIILSGWNPPLVPMAGLPACHTMAQLLPVNGRLNCHCFWRSIDAFTGMPFNIASYAMLTHLLAAISGLEPGVLVASVTDLHIYENQEDAVREQLTRTPLPLPGLVMPDVAALAPDLSIEQVRGLKPEMFELAGYVSHPALKAEVAV